MRLEVGLVIACSLATIVASIDLPVLHQVVRSDWLDVLSMGAVGDGSYDDTDAIQYAFHLLSNTTYGPHLVVYFPHRTIRTFTYTGAGLQQNSEQQWRA